MITAIPDADPAKRESCRKSLHSVGACCIFFSICCIFTCWGPYFAPLSGFAGIFGIITGSMAVAETRSANALATKNCCCDGPTGKRSYFTAVFSFHIVTLVFTVMGWAAALGCAIPFSLDYWWGKTFAITAWVNFVFATALLLTVSFGIAYSWRMRRLCPEPDANQFGGGIPMTTANFQTAGGMANMQIPQLAPGQYQSIFNGQPTLITVSIGDYGAQAPVQVHQMQQPQYAAQPAAIQAAPAGYTYNTAVGAAPPTAYVATPVETKPI